MLTSECVITQQRFRGIRTHISQGRPTAGLSTRPDVLSGPHKERGAAKSCLKLVAHGRYVHRAHCNGPLRKLRLLFHRCLSMFLSIVHQQNRDEVLSHRRMCHQASKRPTVNRSKKIGAGERRIIRRSVYTLQPIIKNKIYLSNSIIC